MAIIVSGHERGLLDSSLGFLGRNDRTGLDDPGSGNQLYINVANGNLVLQERDAFLPSLGDDYLLVRTYNSRGLPSDAHQHDDAGWSFTTTIRLDERHDGGERYFELTYGDGSVFEYRLNALTGLYESVDGAGAYETLEDLNVSGDSEPAFIITRADQTRLSFDRQGHLLSLEDPNGVAMSYRYESDRLVEVRDDEGHVIEYRYRQGHLYRIVDESEGVLAEYHYSHGRLDEVIDRFGHSTRYAYDHQGNLEKLSLPYEQRVDGEREHYERRELRFEYEQIQGLGSERFLSRIIDAEGGVTQFDYSFDPINGQGQTSGTTRVTDALGYNRAYSNEPAYQAWRVANGYYRDYSDRRASHDPAFQAQVDVILQGHSLTYSYNENGLITEVVDQQGYHTRYTYDEWENLIGETDRNAWGATHSDSDYYRALRAELGYTDAAGLGKRVSELSDAERAALEESFTRHYGYDERGNLIWSEDNAGNRTRFSYTDFNQLASTTDPLGHTTSYRYDAHQNLIERIDAGGDITRFEYDVFGNLTRRIVFLDANDQSDPAKQQITRYHYDAYANLIETIDGEGAHGLNDYDHFGNLIRHTDGNGGVTQYTYDRDNRLLTVTNPEGHTTLNRYDAVGNRISITDAAGHTMTRLYDRNNRLICTLDPAGGDSDWDRLTRYSYDVVGNRTRVTDAEGRESEYRYNVRRELVEIISAEVIGSDGVTPTRYSSTLAYDGEGNRIRSTDNRGFVTELLYTEDGLIRQQTDPNGQITRYTYDANANRIQIVAGVQLPAAKRQTLSFSYDEEDQLISQSDA
jgi:YD repeat-containing protein